MPFDWREFLIVAHELRHDPRESIQRTVIGRAYYFAYNAGVNAAQRRGYNPNAPSRTGMHRRLWVWCQQHSDRDIVALGVYGHRLHTRRINADYSPVAPLPWPGEVRNQLGETRDFELLLARVVGQEPTPPLPGT